LRAYNIAVIGATGSTGHGVLSILDEREFPVGDMHAIASKESRGRCLSCGDKKVLKVKSIDEVDFSHVDICFMCAGSGVSGRYVEQITACGCTVIDKSALFRLEKDVPLIIPEVNGDTLKKGASRGIIATPNCIAVPIAMVLNPIHKIYPIKRIVVSTYQSVSGAGKDAIDELYSQTKSAYFGESSNSNVFKKVIAFNVIPEIGDRSSSGITDEEDKIKTEITKIFKGDIKTAVTSVRVPVFIGHGMSVACELEDKYNKATVLKELKNAPGVRLLDRDDLIVTPVDVQNEDDVFVSRIRRDDSVENGLLMWIAADNLRKGASLNGVQIAEKMIGIDPSLKIFKKRS